MVILEEVPGEFVTSGSQHIGSRWPVFATSTGKAILAYLPPDELASLLAQPIRPLTDKTITSIEQLRACLEEIRHQGYAVAAEELELGFIAVGAALLDAGRRPVAAISLGGTRTRMTEARVPEIGELVREAAKRISHKLGYRS
jgi:DNA-binding IclR family transcriptional regulator